MRFITYGTEAIGADRCFNQILHLAAILTGNEPNVVDTLTISPSRDRTCVWLNDLNPSICVAAHSAFSPVAML